MNYLTINLYRNTIFLLVIFYVNFILSYFYSYENLSSTCPGIILKKHSIMYYIFTYGICRCSHMYITKYYLSFDTAPIGCVEGLHTEGL